MARAFATINVVDVALKEEASYGGGGSLSASTDGFELWLENKIPALAEIGHLDDGEMGLQMGGLAEVANVPPLGRFVKAGLPFFFRGPGTAYSSSSYSVLHRILKALGYDATLDATGGAEKWTYTHTPSGSALTSLVAKLMDRAEEITLDCGFVNLKLESMGGKPWKFTADLIGRLNTDIVARALGAVTYPFQSVAIPNGAPAAIVLGSYSGAVVRSFSYEEGRSIENARPDLNAAGYHAGYEPGPRKVRLRTLIEATSLVGSPYHTSSGLNVYKLRDAATQIAATWQLGTAQFNRLKGSASRLQLAGMPQRVESNGVACWDCLWRPVPSTPVASDDLTWVTD